MPVSIYDTLPSIGKTNLLLKSAGTTITSDPIKQSHLNLLKSSTGNHSVGGFTGSNLTGAIKGTASLFNIANSLIDSKHDNTSETEQLSIGNALMMSNNPVTATAGALYSGLSLLGKATGTNSSKLNDSQANAAGISAGGQTLNNLLSYLPFAGAFMKETDTAYRSGEIDKIRGAYTDSANDIDAALSLGNNRYIQANKINAFISDTNDANKLLTQISNINTLRKSSNYGIDLARQSYNRYNGGYKDIAIGREGLKLLPKEELQSIYNSQRKPMTQFLQNGGSILIPKGALHKNKHHIKDNAPEIAEELTQKGIPVIITDENGEVTQVAEIEKEEMVLEKTLTNKVEALWKKGDEDAMIECGKVIVCALFNNCDDNAKLVKSV